MRCFFVASCIGVAWKTYSIPHDWTVGNELLRHTLGLVSTFLLACLVSRLSLACGSSLSVFTFGPLWNLTKFLASLVRTQPVVPCKIVAQVSSRLVLWRFLHRRVTIPSRVPWYLSVCHLCLAIPSLLGIKLYISATSTTPRPWVVLRGSAWL